MSDFEMRKTNECLICGYRDGSKVGIRKHVMLEHTTKEKLDCMVDKVPISEQEA